MSDGFDNAYNIFKAYEYFLDYLGIVDHIYSVEFKFWCSNL